MLGLGVGRIVWFCLGWNRRGMGRYIRFGWRKGICFSGGGGDWLSLGGRLG
jgi:hypothetical protein